jgi:Na+-translocating ferredoxin:NAD+ oxidoreductase subunit C
MVVPFCIFPIVRIRGATLSKRYTFKGGIRPDPAKSQTESLPIEEFPAPSTVIIPLLQHEGTPAIPIVERGDRVLTGQVIGETSGTVSARVHSSVSGVVRSVALFPHPNGTALQAVEIENDGKDDKCPFTSLAKSWRETAPKELALRIAPAGIAGMGGGGFPTHLKLVLPVQKPVDTVIINGIECEPFLTADYRLMIEKIEEWLTGALIIKKITGAAQCFLALNENKPDLLQTITTKLSDTQYAGLTIAKMRAKYPQGSEKQLVKAITGREVPSGMFPVDCKCVVHNVATTLAVRDAVIEGIPLYKRVITVCGSCVRTPKNLLVRIGTPIRSILDACGTDMNAAKKVIIGGPMMGTTQSSIDIPIIKTVCGIVVLEKSVPAVREYPCINCGRCFKACPIRLVPSRIVKLVEKERYDEAEQWHLSDCIECGACSYVCPAKLNIVHFMKLGKFYVTKSHISAQTAL